MSASDSEMTYVKIYAGLGVQSEDRAERYVECGMVYEPRTIQSDNALPQKRRLNRSA